MKAVILAGGFGTRLQEQTELRPKPMVEIGGVPILIHIMNIYARHGFKEFVLALGYKAEIIKNYFLSYYYQRSDFTIDLGKGELEVHDGSPKDWVVHLTDTGLKTMTGGRVKRLQEIIGDETFMLTYGDGVANIDLRKLLDFHHLHRCTATVTAVRPPARFGGLSFQGDLVARFVEKPQIDEGWINGGFFVMEPEVFDYIDGDDTILERDPLERLAKEGQLAAYRHGDFWHCMDTLRDVRYLEKLWAQGDAPWKVWDE